MARLRPGATDLARAFARSPLPVYLLNSRRMIVFANEACGAWLGVDVDELLGIRCDYHSLELANHVQALAGGLAPPPEAYLAGHTTGLVSATRNGTIEERSADFYALPDPEEPTPGLLAIVSQQVNEPPEGLTTGVEPSSAELHVLLRWVRQTFAQRSALDRFVGDEPRIKRVRDQFSAAGDRARVIVIGPRGCGKEQLARGIHFRRQLEQAPPLVDIACATVDAESLQMAITSLVRQRAAGELGAAALLLHDVDELSAPAQRELLGFLELPGFEVRTLATAVRSLTALANEGTFDRSLAYALSTLVIEVPPLSERMTDLPLIVQALVEENNATGGKQLSGVSSEALDRLAFYSWPGDMDQLVEVIKGAWTKAAGPHIVLGDLPRWLAAAEDALACPAKRAEPIVLDEFLADIERELLTRSLRRSRGNKAKAARLLGISRPRLLRRLEQLGLVELTDPIFRNHQNDG